MDTEEFENKDINIINDYSKEGQELQKINDRIQNLELTINTVNEKIDKLIQSNKSLIQYFSSINERNVRDLNFNIRMNAIAHNKLFPAPFVPEKR
jgi:predicted nuclease with TOPRIM domain